MTDLPGGDRDGEAILTRRRAWRAAVGIALATGLFARPDALDAVWAREPDVRPERRRPGKGLFRDSALTVVNKTGVALTCTFFSQVRSSGDSYGPPVADGDRSIAPDESFRYAPDRFRVGVLVKNADPGVDLYADVRNVQFWYPRGGVSSGADLDPANGDVGDPFVREQNYAQGERHKKAKIVLKRNDDSANFIEWELIVGEPRRAI